MWKKEGEALLLIIRVKLKNFYQFRATFYQSPVFMVRIVNIEAF